VTAVHEHSTFTLVVLELGSEILEVTPSHRIYAVCERAWVAARELRPGSIVLGLDGQPRSIAVVGERRLPEPLRVYTLSVEQYHSYHVGPGLWRHCA
jgi:hypothetical protein